MRTKLLLAGAFLAVTLGATLLLGASLWFRFLRSPEVNSPNVEACANCLSDGLSLDSAFGTSPDHIRSAITVRQKLLELRAYCRNGKIYDGAGKLVLFVRMPERAVGTHSTKEFENGRMQGVLQREKEVADLEVQYTVVRMYGRHYPN